MKDSFWNRDITHEMVGVLAVFGLVVSSLVATTGVAALGVEAQIAFAGQDSVGQSAAVTLGDERPGRPMMGGIASSTPRMDAGRFASSSTMMYCPKISKALARGGKDATTTGEVSELQRFIAERYDLNPGDVVTGYFGSTTQAYLEKFQQEQGIPPAPIAGPLTRAVIAKLCGGGKDQTGSSTPKVGNDGRGGPGAQGGEDTMHSASSTMMGSTTPHMPRPLPPVTEERHVMPPAPKSTTSNGAAVIEAIGEIGDGVGKLVGASLSLFGL